MFEVRTKSGVMLKNMMFAIKEVFDSVKWFCTPDGISLYGLDITQSSVIKVQLNTDLFDKYRCDRNLTFAMKTTSLAKVLKYVTIEDSITIKANELRTDRIYVSVEPFSPSSIEVEWTQYEIKLIDYNLTEQDINPEHYMTSAAIHMPSAKLQRICRDLGQVGDRVTIACSVDGVARFGTKGEFGTGLVTLYPTVYVDEQHMEVKIEVKEPMTQTFGLKILTQLAKATSLTPQVIVNLRQWGPIELIYNINVAKISPNNIPHLSTVAALRFYLSSDVEIED